MMDCDPPGIDLCSMGSMGSMGSLGPMAAVGAVPVPPTGPDEGRQKDRVAANVEANRLHFEGAAKLGAAWKSLRQEFDVQVLIWQSKLLRSASGAWMSTLDMPDSQEALVRNHMEAAMSSPTSDPVGALLALQVAVQTSVQGGGLLNRSCTRAAMDVISAMHAMKVLGNIEETLRASGLPVSAQQVENMLAESGLEDQHMQQFIRKVTGILPKAPPVSQVHFDQGHGLGGHRGHSHHHAHEEGTGDERLARSLRVKNTFIHVAEDSDGDSDSDSFASEFSYDSRGARSCNSSHRSRSVPSRCSNRDGGCSFKVPKEVPKTKKLSRRRDGAAAIARK